MKLNKKGFTLVELLAVIVILAVVMLVAITAIGPVMERANKGALSSSAQIILSGAENAYTADQMKSSSARIFKSGSPVCVSIKALEDGGYFDAKGKKYMGSVLVDVAADGKATYTIWVMEVGGTYSIANKTAGALGVDAVNSDSNNTNNFGAAEANTQTNNVFTTNTNKAFSHCGNVTDYGTKTYYKLG